MVRTPFRAPNANAHAERFVRTIKEECLNWIIPFGTDRLRRAIDEFVDHYHRERNHQGIGKELIDGEASVHGLRGRHSPPSTHWGPLGYCFRAA